jgi:ABC-type transport system involved in cytochrome bd biosynthesis fused ATPase/permease subunit
MILVGKTTETLTRRQYSTFSRMSAFFLDSIRGLVELKNLGHSHEHTERLDR